MAPRLFIVVPCYNEQEVLPETAKRLLEKLHGLSENGRIAASSRILFVDDGSKDKTRDIIRNLHDETNVCQGLFLSRNRGHQNALLAGLMTVRELADCCISMDADLQDDVNAIDEMVAQFSAGKDIVYGVRSSRKTDTAFKRGTANGFYKTMRAMGAETVENHADFRLLSKRALSALAQFGEKNLFLRGMIPMLGFETGVVYYERASRFAGESKYPLKKMIRFATEGITSLSTEPLKWITRLGIFIFAVSIVILIYSLVRYFTGNTIPGWTTTVLSIWAIGGLMMISLGVIGEYIGKIYLESKGRPRYIIEAYLNDDGDHAPLTDPSVHTGLLRDGAQGD